MNFLPSPKTGDFTIKIKIYSLLQSLAYKKKVMHMNKAPCVKKRFKDRMKQKFKKSQIELKTEVL